MKKSLLSPKNLKALRDRKNWSQEELAKRSGLTARSISQWEISGASQIPVQQKSFSGLVRALGERAEVLSGDASLPSESKPHKIQMKLHPQTRLNLDLLSKRYGVTIDDVVNVAPLLFVKAAEAALTRQAQELKKDENTQESEGYLEHTLGLRDHNDEHDGFHPGEYFEVRDAAINNRDIFEAEADYYYEDYFERPNPFANYLQEECVQHRIGQILKHPHTVFSYFSDYRIPQYLICSDELEQITCGSWIARMALVYGVTTVPEIPEDLWEPQNSGKRVAWLEGKYQQAQAADEEEQRMWDQGLEDH
jgi:transcriptional regulator with XRE-family HTH domain